MARHRTIEPTPSPTLHQPTHSITRAGRVIMVQQTRPGVGVDDQGAEWSLTAARDHVVTRLTPREPGSHGYKPGINLRQDLAKATLTGLLMSGFPPDDPTLPRLVWETADRILAAEQGDYPTPASRRAGLPSGSTIAGEDMESTGGDY